LNPKRNQKKSNHKHSFFYNYTISKHREFKQQRNPKLVVDLLFKKKKKLKNRRKLKEHKQAKKIFENKKSFSRIFFLLYSAVKKTRRALPISHKKNKKSFLSEHTAKY